MLRLVVFIHRVNIIGRLGLIRQPRRRLAHIELAGDHVGDQAGAVLAEERDFAPRAFDGSDDTRGGVVDEPHDRGLFG